MKRLFFTIIEDAIRNISGGLGRKIRKAWYTRRLRKCGKNLDIAAGVHIISPELIELGDNCAIDFNVILLAGKIPEYPGTRYKEADGFDSSLRGMIKIGRNSHIGINNIIQGNGGVEIGDYFTSSANCHIYSFSNDPRTCKAGTMDFDGETNARYISGPVIIGRNVWLGLHVNVISATIGNDVFAKPNAVISKKLGDNMIVEGAPAVQVANRF